MEDIECFDRLLRRNNFRPRSIYRAITLLSHFKVFAGEDDPEDSVQRDQRGYQSTSQSEDEGTDPEPPGGAEDSGKEFAPLPKPPPNVKLPDSDLLKALHAYTSDLFSKLPQGPVGYKSMDGTALIALGILVEELAREGLGETGDLALTEAALEDDQPSRKWRNGPREMPFVLDEPSTLRPRKRRCTTGENENIQDAEWTEEPSAFEESTEPSDQEMAAPPTVSPRFAIRNKGKQIEKKAKSQDKLPENSQPSQGQEKTLSHQNEPLSARIEQDDYDYDVDMQRDWSPSGDRWAPTPVI